jgi:2-keto-4-pentenoate hydratase
MVVGLSFQIQICNHFFIMDNPINQAAELLWNSAETQKTVPPVREIISATDIDTAYQVQQVNVEKRLARGEQIVGKKIGLTSFAVQKQLGVDQPDYGMLFNTTQVDNGGSLPHAEMMQPKAEAEIAFVMKKDLSENITLESLVDAIDYAMASIELVGSRVENWDIRITDTIADNASASHFVLGDKQVKINDIDLVNCKMSMTQNGEIASEGSGKACMDNPLNAALWLAQVMAKNGTPLKAGELLLSGALGPMVPINKGDHFEANIEGLGSVSVTIN